MLGLTWNRIVELRRTIIEYSLQVEIYSRHYFWLLLHMQEYEGNNFITDYGSVTQPDTKYPYQYRYRSSIKPNVILQEIMSFSLNELRTKIPEAMNRYEAAIMLERMLLPFSWFYYPFYYKYCQDTLVTSSTELIKYPTPAMNFITRHEYLTGGSYIDLLRQEHNDVEKRQAELEAIAVNYWGERAGGERMIQIANSGIYRWFWWEQGMIKEGNPYWIFGEGVSPEHLYVITDEEYAIYTQQYLKNVEEERIAYEGKYYPREYVIYPIPDDLIPKEHPSLEAIRIKYSNVSFPTYPNLTSEENFRYIWYKAWGRTTIVIGDYQTYIVTYGLRKAGTYHVGGTAEQNAIADYLYIRADAGFRNYETLQQNSNNGVFDFSSLEGYKSLPAEVPKYQLPDGWLTIVPNYY